MVGPTNGKIVLQRQTVHADAVAGLPLPGLCRTAERSVVDFTADFLHSAQLSPLFRVTGNDGFLTKSLLTMRLHSKLDAVKTMGTHGKINAIEILR